MRAFTRTAAVSLLVAWAGLAQGQTLLQRLEGRLNNALGPGAPAQPNAAQPTPAELPAPSDASSGYLGLIGDDAPEGAGLLVNSVVPEGPAENSGLRAGDLVVVANGVAIHNQDDMGTALVDQGPGAKIPVTIVRNGERQTLTVTLGTRSPTPSAIRDVEDPGPAPFTPPPAGADPSFGASGPAATLGVTAAPITADAVSRYGLATTRGALITAVRPGTPADRAGLPIGGVVVAVDGRRIDTSDDLIGMIRASRPGQEMELSYYQGDRLFRKTVRLAPAAPAIAPGLSLAITPDGTPNGDRPLLNKVGRLIDGISRGEGGGIINGIIPGANQGQAGGAPAVVPNALPGEFQEPPTLSNQAAFAAMQKRIDLLEQEVHTLNERVRWLEGQFPTPSRKQDEELRLTPPARPTPPPPGVP